MSIDNLKSVISRRQGVLMPNRFAIYMPVPLFANLDIRSIVSAGIAGGSVASGINSVFNDPRDLTFLCKTASLPGRQIATTDYSTNPKPKKMPYAGITDDVTLTFMLTQDMFAKKFFDAWQSQIINPDYSINYKDTYTKDIIVQQLNKDNFPVYTVLFKNAYPVTVDAIELSADSSDTISTMSVSLAYDDWQSTDDLLDATLSSLNVALPGNVGDRIGSLVDDLTSKFNSI
jgi:hypothetical protein|tara:strand:+ start:1461 stop:2153 length:693 start_codon:yes stop_codon:yes gene_type:complete